MELVILVLFLVCVLLAIWVTNIRKENRVLKQNLALVKDSLNAIATKPIFAAITDSQIEKLGQVIASYLHPKEWLN